jgi:hypothetical protein
MQEICMQPPRADESMLEALHLCVTWLDICLMLEHNIGVLAAVVDDPGGGKDCQQLWRTHKQLPFFENEFYT